MTDRRSGNAPWPPGDPRDAVMVAGLYVAALPPLLAVAALLAVALSAWGAP